MKINSSFNDLADKHVLITGGGSGIGAALTTGFLSQKAKVSFVQRSNADDFVSRAKEEYEAPCLGIQGNITNLDTLKDVVNKARQELGPIDILINNAGNDEKHSLNMTFQEWENNIAINLRPYFFAAQFVAEEMKKQSYGVIINISSYVYITGRPGYPAYVMSNAGIVGLTRTLARELGPNNIRVNTLVPGLILTDKKREDKDDTDYNSEYLSRQCLSEYLTPKDVIEPTLFLASTASRMITGQAMMVDGGMVFVG